MTGLKGKLRGWYRFYFFAKHDACKRLFMFFIFCSLIVIVSLVYNLKIYRQLNDTNEKYTLAIEYVDQIRFMDELLTMSSRMFAATGSIRWQERYLEYETRLDDVLLEASELKIPGDMELECISKMNKANTKLVELEKQSFALMHANEVLEAREILSSDEYYANKQELQKYLDMFLEDTVGKLRSNMKEMNGKYELVTYIVSSIVILGFFAFFYCFWRLKRIYNEALVNSLQSDIHHKNLLKDFDKLDEFQAFMSEDLKGFIRDLDDKIAELEHDTLTDDQIKRSMTQLFGLRSKISKIEKEIDQAVMTARVKKAL